MNLTMAGFWFTNLPGPGWVDMNPTRVNADGSVKSLLPGETAYLPLAVPAHNPNGTAIRCTYAGTGTLTIAGDATEVQVANKSVQFRTLNRYPNATTPYLALSVTDPVDPIRQIDCREVGASPTKLFADEFLASLAPFGVIRFLDWQNINANVGGNWAERTRAESFVTRHQEGVAVEHMVALTNELNADPWFLMPYNADEEFVTRFAQYVHDHLAPGRRVYVELSNEVWNYGFPVTHQAIREGEAAGLGTGWGAGLNRYSQKSAWMLRIWTRIFADKPEALVRVVSSQHANITSGTTVLSFGDTASVVDAYATAPYFGHDLFSEAPASASLDEYMLTLGQLVDREIQTSLANKALATSHGIRHITYEAGQHVVKSDNVALVGAINRDPRMYDLYARYMSEWRTKQGDLMTLFNSTYPVAQFGAWGLREYAGQPLGETPKRRAAIDAAARN
jgi:hypothetical protein